MSDIPLRTFRRSRNSRSGYAPLKTEQDEYDANENGSVIGNRNNQQNMPAQTIVTKVAASAANQRWKGKKKQGYQDDLEEQEGLLGDAEGRDSEEEVGRAGPARLPAHEVCSNPHTARFHLIPSSDQLHGRVLARNTQAVPKTSPEPSRSDHQVSFGKRSHRSTPPNPFIFLPR